MYTIIEHIEYLLTSHDCVVIPGWGALVAQYSDSRYNPVAGHIERPRRELGFNASVDHNDGLLAQSLVRREGVTYDEAMRFVRQSVSAFRQQLAMGNEVSLGRLGYFHSADGHRIEFTPFYHEQSNDGYYGLRSVKFQPLAVEDRRAQAQADAAAAFSSNAAHRHGWSRAVKVAASILVLMCLTVVLTTPVIVNRNQQDYATLNLPTVTKPQQQVLNVPRPAADTTMCRDTNGAEEQPAEQPTSHLLLDEGGNSLLVVASFGSRKQAEAYMQMHPDMARQMQVARASERLYHVFVARSYDQTHLYAVRNHLPDGYGDSWVKP